MKKLFTLLNIALVAGSLPIFMSCNKENNMNGETNVLEIYGDDYTLESISLTDYGCFAAIHEGYGIVVNFSYQGDSPSERYNIDFICSNESNIIEDMTYAWIDNNIYPIPVGRFTDTYSGFSNWTGGMIKSLGIDPSTGLEKIYRPENFTEGYLKIKKLDDNLYLIEFSCKDVNGKIVKGHYKGSIIICPKAKDDNAKRAFYERWATPSIDNE